MDNGEVIPALNESWSFAGAKVMEWASGFVAMIIVQELFLSTPAKSMPILIVVMFGTTLGLASVRRLFPDEERGLSNTCMVKLGIEPPNIPAPAPFQPIWSGTPVRELPEKKEFRELELHNLFHEPEEEEGEAYS